MQTRCPICHASTELDDVAHLEQGGVVRCPRCRSRIEPAAGQISAARERPGLPGPATTSPSKKGLPPGCQPLAFREGPSSGSGRSFKRVMQSTWYGRLVLEGLNLVMWYGLIVLVPALAMGLGLLIRDASLGGRLAFAAIVVLMIVSRLMDKSDTRRRQRLPGALVLSGLGGGGAYLAFDRVQPAFAADGALIIGVMAFVVWYFDWPSAD